jgi:TonB family protein
MLDAFVLHSFVISALAFGFKPSPNGTSQELYAEMIFEKEGAAPQEIACVNPIPSKQQTKKDISKPHHASIQTKESSGVPTSCSSEGVSCDPLFNPPPIYPREARRKKIEGVVHIRLSVSPEGIVDQATVLPPRINPLLEEAALQAVRQWKFKPMATILEVPIEFKLEV